MKGKGSTPMLLVVALICTPSAPSQSNDPRSQPKANLRVEHKTDHGTGITSVKLEPMLIQYDEASKSYITFSAFCSYEDNSPTKPKFIALYFHSRSPSRRFPDGSGLLLLLDAETIKLTTGDNNKSGEGATWAFSERERDVFNESYSVFISEQTLIKMITAKKVEVQFGRIDLSFSEAHRQALRDLAARIVNAKGAV